MVFGIGLIQSTNGETYYYIKSDGTSIFRKSKSGLNEETIYSLQSPYFPIALLAYPDGKSLLVIAAREQVTDTIFIGTLQIDDKKMSEFSEVNQAVNGGGAWFEPGKSLVLSRGVNGLINLWKYELGSKSLTQLTLGTGPDYNPMTDPTGKGIYYENGKLLGTLNTYDVNSNSSIQIFPELSSQPIISPDGKKVMFVKIVEPFSNSELWVSNIDGKNQIKLASGAVVGTGLWSWDNTKVSFFIADKLNEKNKGFIATADGRQVTEIQPIEGNIQSILWSADSKNIYLSASAGPTTRLWKANADGTGAEKFVEEFYAIESTPDGKYLLGVILAGKNAGIYEVSLSDRKRIPLVLGIETFMVRMARDKKAFLYPVAGRGEILFYRQEWNDGKLIGEPKIALKLPFEFPIEFLGNAYDFSSDLSTIVYAKPSGQADFYLLSFENN